MRLNRLMTAIRPSCKLWWTIDTTKADILRTTDTSFVDNPPALGSRQAPSTNNHASVNGRTPRGQSSELLERVKGKEVDDRADLPGLVPAVEEGALLERETLEDPTAQ